MMMWGHGPWGNGVYLWMDILMMVIFWGLVIWFGVSLFMRNRNQSSRNGALDILRERYARGEIDSEEFNRRKEVLKNYR